MLLWKYVLTVEHTLLGSIQYWVYVWHASMHEYKIFIFFNRIYLLSLEGNNVYGDNIRKLLEGVASDEVRQTHILMDMINSPVQRGVVLAKGSHTPVETGIISELGIYGVFVRLEETN